MMVAILCETVVRSSVIVALCWPAALLFRSRSAEIRHFIWCGALYSLLLLPPLQFAMVPRMWAMPYAETITAVYLAAVFVLLARFLITLSYVRGIVRRSEAIFDGDLRELVHETWLQSLSCYRPEVRLSGEVCVPMTAGVHESCILLPRSCADWPREKLQAVLLHELAHMRRGDPAIAFLSSLVVCLFWIHPLAYWLRRRLAALAEEAWTRCVMHASWWSLSRLCRLPAAAFCRCAVWRCIDHRQSGGSRRSFQWVPARKQVMDGCGRCCWSRSSRCSM